MPVNHQVAAGEHLSMIASQYGFPDYTVIWNHANNSNLKQQRKNPNVLMAGDNLYIPDKEQKQHPGGTSQRHSFELTIDRLTLNLVFEDSYEKPVANAAGTLTIDQNANQVTTDGKGQIQHEIAPDLARCTLVLNSTDTAFNTEALTILIGHLDPVDTLTGQYARLNNLGYAAGSNTTDATDPMFLSAVQEFQCDQKLTVDGQPGPATQAKLLQVHGC